MSKLAHSRSDVVLSNELENQTNLVVLKATQYLARREYAYYELFDKLRRAGFDSAVVTDVLENLKKSNLQSDNRYVKDVITSKMRKGYGPNHIYIKINQFKINKELVSEILEAENIDWHELLKKVHAKKYRDNRIDNNLEKQKRIQFLLYRGFTHDQIHYFFKTLPNERQ